MKKNLLNEINQMKFLFGYKPGRVLSEQEMPEMDEGFRELDIEEPEMGFEDDIVDFDFGPEVAEPAIAPDVKPDVKPDTDRPAPRIRPDRDPSRLPNPDPDTHPQGRRKHMEEIDMDEMDMDDDIEELFDK